MASDVPPDVDRQLAKAYLAGVATGAVGGGLLLYPAVREFWLLPFRLMLDVMRASITHFVIEPLSFMPAWALAAMLVLATGAVFELYLTQYEPDPALLWDTPFRYLVVEDTEEDEP